MSDRAAPLAHSLSLPAASYEEKRKCNRTQTLSIDAKAKITTTRLQTGFDPMVCAGKLQF